MADSDYTIRGTGIFCKLAELTNDIDPLQTTVAISGYQALADDPPAAGEAAMLNGEVVRVVSFTSASVEIARGCADTIPTEHSAGSVLWFIEDSVGYETQQRLSGETVGVKLLPRLATGNSVPLAGSPPQALTLDWRFARPYPPGLVLCQGQPWFDEVTVDVENDPLVLTWKHRDRITQMDQLIDHTAENVGPEPGTTYEVRVYDAANALRRTEIGITGNLWSYARATVLADFSITLGSGPAVVPGYIILSAARDGLSSWQQYRIDFEIDATVPATDPSFASVALLVHANGVPGSTTFTDKSSAPKTITVVGDAKVSAAAPKFGTGSVLLDGTGDYLTVAHASAFNLSGTNWTVELQVFRQVEDVAHTLISKRGAGSAYPFEISIGADNMLKAVGTSAGGATVFSLTDITEFPLQDLTAVAVTKSGNDYRLFRDGVLVATATNATALGDNTDPVVIGAGATGANPFNGRLDEIRITRTARYTANYTPQSAQFPDA